MSLLVKCRRQRYDRLSGSPVVPPSKITNGSPVHSLSFFLQYSRTEFNRNQGNAVAGHVWILARGTRLTGFRLLSVEKQVRSYPCGLHNHLNWGKKDWQDQNSLSFSFRLFYQRFKKTLLRSKMKVWRATR